jgi:hypothetical protein
MEIMHKEIKRVDLSFFEPASAAATTALDPLNACDHCVSDVLDLPDKPHNLPINRLLYIRTWEIPVMDAADSSSKAQHQFYISSEARVLLASMCIWLLASALAPNLGAQIVFRFLLGLGCRFFSGTSNMRWHLTLEASASSSV